MNSPKLVLRNPTLIIVVLASLLTLGFNLSAVIGIVPTIFADDGDKKECKKNEGGNNCNDSKKSASPELECKNEIQDNDGSSIDSECTNNSQILTDSIIISRPGDGGGNGDTTRPTVIGVVPNDNQNNVPLNTEIGVVFSKSVDQDTLDDGSLDIFCETTCDIDNVGVNADPSDKSVTYTLDRLLEPGTRYEAQLDSNIQDINGNLIDCSDSNEVDSSCAWQFETTGNANANIELSPTSGPIGTSVKAVGTGFNPNSDVLVTFNGTNVVLTSTNNNGEFSADFEVPISLTGAHTVTASDGINSDSATFTVTATVPAGPSITLNQTSGPIGTPVRVSGTGFEPDSSVSITFDDISVPTTPAIVTTNPQGEFSGVTFIVPDSPNGPQEVEAVQGTNSASKPFTVTPGTISIAMPQGTGSLPF
jgi:hypothetical protein